MAVANPSPTLQLTETVRHGFPENPSCMAYDCVQDVLAFGSQSGEIVVFGRPGLEIRFKAPCAVLKLQFSINKGVIAVYCSDQSCYFWSIRTNEPKLLGVFKLPGKENLTVLYWPYNSNTVYIGTSSGNVLFVVIELTEIHGIAVNANVMICEDTIYWNKVTVPSQGFRRDHPGKIVSLEEHPLEPVKVLIAFEQGLCIIWNLQKKEVEYRYQHANLECASWNGGSGKEYAFCSTEGQIVGVTLKKKEEKILYQCPGIGSITNLQTYNIKQNKWILFVKCYISDGMSRTEVIVLGEKNVLCSLSFDQPVVDILCIPSTPFKAERQMPKALVVLQQGKLDVLDLQIDLSRQSPVPFNIPFSFNTLSSVGFLHNGGHCLSQTTVDKLTVLKAKLASQRLCQGLSSNPWPFQGGKVGNTDISGDSPLPILLATSAFGQADSITIWLSFSDLLENLFTINTAKVFPLNYTNPPQELSGSFDTTSDTASQGAADSDKQLDIKFLSVNMMDETLVFVNHRGNVLVYKFSQLQPAYEVANSVEVLLNEVEQVDSSSDISSQLPWRFWPGKETNQIHLLHHVCCVLNWEDSVQLVSIESAVYNDKINTLLLGTHIAMVVVDLKNNGTIVIDTLKTLKLSRCLSSNSNNQMRIAVESKTKSGLLKRIGGKKKDKRSSLHESTPFKSSFVDMVFFTLNMREQPSLTVWMGTESGELVVYKLLRNPSNDKEVQMISTSTILHQKEPIMELIFMTEKCQKIDSNVKWHSSLLDSKQLVDQDDPTVCNYVIVQTKQKVESFGFPSKKVTPIGKFNGTRNHIAKSFLSRLNGAQYILLILAHGEIQLCSLPALNPITLFNVTPDIQPMNMLSFTTNGQGLYVVKSSEIQKVTVEALKEESDGPADSTNCQSTFVPLSGPLKPTDTQQHLISKKIVSHDKCDRPSWFTPKKTFISSKTRGQTKSMPSHYSSKTKSTDVTQTSSPYERTAQALDERGKRLNNVVETTSKLLQLAEIYADGNAQT